MTVDETELTVGDATYPARIDAPDEDADWGVVLLPGAGHGPFGDVFDDLAAEAAASGYRFLRFESWQDHDELDAKTLGDLHAELDAAIDRLHADGCDHVALVGKSFGGGVALTYVPDAVERVVLWAPAIEFDPEDDPDPETYVDDSFETVDRLRIGPSGLSTIDVPVLICHGDEDGLPLENSQRIADAVETAEVSVIEGENHSFLEVEDGACAVERTIAFLDEARERTTVE